MIQSHKSNDNLSRSKSKSNIAPKLNFKFLSLSNIAIRSASNSRFIPNDNNQPSDSSVFDPNSFFFFNAPHIDLSPNEASLNILNIELSSEFIPISPRPSTPIPNELAADKALPALVFFNNVDFPTLFAFFNAPTKPLSYVEFNEKLPTPIPFVNFDFPVDELIECVILEDDPTPDEPTLPPMLAPTPPEEETPCTLTILDAFAGPILPSLSPTNLPSSSPIAVPMLAPIDPDQFP